MIFREMAEKIRSGEIVLDVVGHQTHASSAKFLKQYDHHVAMAQGANDGEWEARADETVEEVDAGMREFYEQLLNREIEEGSRLPSLDDAEYCDGCGKRLYWFLSGNQLKLQIYWDWDKFVRPPDGYICPYAKPQPTRGEIQVANTLIFANFFRDFEDHPPDVGRTEEWSINSQHGRNNVTKFKCAQNIAYGQMSNMSVGIFLHPDKRSIIVGDPYIAEHLCEDMTDEEYDKADMDALSVIDGHKLIGDICLDVWRWEATDLKTIGLDNYEKLKKDHEFRGLVEIDVEPGAWAFEHYFDSKTSSNEAIYSKLVWKASQ